MRLLPGQYVFLDHDTNRQGAKLGLICRQCCLLTGVSPLMREDLRRGVAIVGDISEHLITLGTYDNVCVR